MQSASISIEPIGAGFLGDGKDAQPRAENCTACLFGHFFWYDHPAYSALVQ